MALLFDLEEIVNDISQKYQNTMNTLNKIATQHNTGGAIRKMRGEFVDYLVDDISVFTAMPRKNRFV
jgi:hypothetical protein